MEDAHPVLGSATASSNGAKQRSHSEQPGRLIGGREYRVGRFTLQPFRQLLDCGHTVPIKPKALAILSVLAEAEGALVTKDDLMAAVWPNITVEDNSIQAHVASLRKILGPDAELLCTVHGYGYQLVPTPVICPPEVKTGPAAPVSAANRWPLYSMLAMVLVVAAAAASLLLFRTGAPGTPAKKTAQVAILPFDLSGSGPEMRGLADDLTDQISVDLSLARILTASGPDGKAPLPSSSARQMGAEFLLSGRIKSDGNRFDVHVQLSDAEEHVAVWSGTFEKSVAARSTLLTNVATAVAYAAQWAVMGREGKVRLNAAGVAAFVEARESIGGQGAGSRSAGIGGPTSAGLEMAEYRKIIAMTPEFTWGHSGLAAADAFQFRTDTGNQALRKEVQQEAKRALELEPHNGEAYVALELAAPRFNWREREALLLKGYMADPDFEPAAMHEARLLWAVGRNHDALPWFTRAYSVDPLHNDDNFTYAASLASEGHLKESQKLIEQMDARWPGDIKTRDAHFWTSVISGSTGDALAIVADAAKWPLGMNQKAADVWRAALDAHASKQNSARARAIKLINDTAADGSLSRGQALLLLSMLNDIDGAFAQAQDFEPADPKWGPFLFLGPTQAMRFDRRFMSLAAKFGFAAYWRSTGHWPDFCSAPDLPYNCVVEVDKLAADDPELKPVTVLRPIAANY